MSPTRAAFLFLVAPFVPVSARRISISDLLLRDFVLPPLFSGTSAWRQRADGAAVLPDSDDQLQVLYRALVGDSSGLSATCENLSWPFMYINVKEYSVPIFLADDEHEQNVEPRDYEGNPQWPSPDFPVDEVGRSVLPAPAGLVRPSDPLGNKADGHLVLYWPYARNFASFDFWAATTLLDPLNNSLGGGYVADRVIWAGALARFDLSGDGASDDGDSSARATGTPLLGGMLLPEDIENGVIEHALAFAIPLPRNLAANPSSPLASDYFYPASTTETDFYNTDPLALAAGQRIRLKQNLVNVTGWAMDDSEFAPITRMFLTSLRTYGAYLVDGACGFSFCAEDVNTANLRLSDAQVNELIGQPANYTLPGGKSKWQIIMYKLQEDLDLIPLGSGAFWEYGDSKDPATAIFDTSNFEVVAMANLP